MKIPKDKRCVDCGTELIDEFPDLIDEFPDMDYIGCSGCPRIYKREGC